MRIVIPLPTESIEKAEDVVREIYKKTEWMGWIEDDQGNFIKGFS